MRRRTVQRSVAGLVIALLLAGCTGGPDGSAPPTNPSAPTSCGLAGQATTPPAATHTTQPPPGTSATAAVGVDLGRTLGPVNDNLLGMVWNTGDSLDPVRAIHPPTIRIDASLQSASQGPDQLDLTALEAKVAKVRAIGAEPLVLLSYMPRWLGQPNAGTNDPTRVGPADLDAWQALVTKVVRALATAPAPAYQFEVWNEPDLPTFWQDTPDAFAQMAVRTTRAVVAVKQETGKPLLVGGPAAAFGGVPDSMLPYLKAVVADHLPLDFYSWHRYANTPYLGPDGPEGNLPDDVYKALAKRNPAATPVDYAKEIATVRAKLGTVLAGSGLHPKLIIDEWNVSGGGYDLRNDDAEGAALDAGILIEMERNGLDGADFYRAISGDNNHLGDWGLVTSAGAPKPSWWVMRAWGAMSGQRLATTDVPASGVWARATRDRTCVNVLLANFVATGSPAHDVTVTLAGRLPRCRSPRTTTLARLDTSSTTLADGTPIKVRRGQFHVQMPSQSVALATFGCGR